MKISASFFKLSVIFMIVFMLLGCSESGKYGEEVPQGKSSDSGDLTRFDPLDLPEDTQIIPQQHPRIGAITVLKDTAMTDIDTTGGDTTAAIVEVPKVVIDSLSNQVFRIQLYATELFGDAKREVRIAEEIFDQSVYLHYEVPYYKVRAGDFASRVSAEQYLQKAKLAGYRNAWVVTMKVVTKKTEPLYEDFPFPEVNVPIEDDDE